MKDEFSQRGRSMVETMGYMVIVITLVAAIGHLIANAFEEHRYSRASIQLSEFAGSIVRASAIDPDYTDVVAMINGTYNKSTSATNTKKNAEGLKLIPASFHLVGRKIYHAFGGEVVLANPSATQFSIEFKNLSPKQCIELAMKDWQKNHNVDLNSIVINSNNYWFWPIYHEISGNNVNALPVTRAKLTGTSANDTGQCHKDSNSIVWIFN